MMIILPFILSLIHIFYAALMSMLTTMKGIPLAYNKDMQEDKELTFDAIDTVKGCLALFNGMLSTMHFKKDRMENSAKNGFTNATDEMWIRDRCCGTDLRISSRRWNPLLNGLR